MTRDEYRTFAMDAQMIVAHTACGLSSLSRTEEENTAERKKVRTYQAQIVEKRAKIEIMKWEKLRLEMTQQVLDSYIGEEDKE